ncbi:Ig-like domain-containing protein [Thalassolituus sp. C2-1]|uniref:Ig-like domain-containing protein n=1 Tax=Venatorbacter sp. C2-1 TaxID=2597518 RepID=UPI001197139B|nr:Ig-like domain-containing protein [Thalassolituus sp. C2-1]TVV41888.1 hypothetical protein FOT50_18025 [Thalassolituus sp. C2-1]
MFKPTALISLLLTLLLTACGGDSGGSVAGGSNTDDNTPGTGGDGNPDTSIPIVLQVGSGDGVGFTSGVMSFLAVSGSTDIDVTVTVTDQNNSNALVSGNYRGVFEAGCLVPLNSDTAIIQSSSSITKRFKNEANCTSDTISANVYPLGSTTLIGTASVDLNDIIPPADTTIPAVLQVGSGTGVDFIPGAIDISVSESTTDLDVTVTVTDKNNGSAAVSGNYRGVFTAGCFVPVNGDEAVIQNSSSITKHFKNTSNCTTDTVSVSVYPFAGATLIGTASGSIDNSVPSVETPLPSLGSGSGAAFRESQIAATSFSLIAGGSLPISVSAVDKNKGNSLLTGDYSYKFSSVCEAAGTAKFTSKTSLLSSGVGASEYVNISCSGSDTITARLFAPNVDSSIDSNAIASATLTIKTALPKLGSGAGADFINGLISGDDTLEGLDSLELSASVVNPLSNNVVLSGSNYELEWSSSCATGEFTLSEQNLSNADIRTRYFSDPSSCIGTDTVSLSLYERNNPSVILATATKDIVVSLGVDAKLGFGSGGSFVENTLQISPAILAAGGTALITANVVDGNNADALVVNKAYGLTVSSECSDQGQAEFVSAEQIVFQGEARFSYTAQGCEGVDGLTVNLYAVTNGEIDKTRLLKSTVGSITVNKAQIGAILSGDISASQLSVTSIANKLLPTQSEVTFRVVDRNGLPVPNQEVRFSLNSEVGGINLTIDSAITDADGQVKAIVNSGTTHAITSVIAETTTEAGNLLKTSSLPISITTGYPDQNSFNLVADILNPLGFDVDGTSVQFTVRAGDAFGNPVPDGTIINFIAESGLIEPTCPISGGSCSVNWVSTNPRPGFNGNGVLKTNAAGYPGYDATWQGGKAGVATVLAYSVGEAGFADKDGDGLLDALGVAGDESFFSMGEAFLDANEDGVFNDSNTVNPYEKLVDYDKDGSWDAAPAVYEGASCSQDTLDAGVHCQKLVHVRDSVQFIVAAGRTAPAIELVSVSGGITADLSGNSCINVRNEGSVTFTFNATDYNGNIPPIDTAISFEAEGFEIVSEPPASVPNSNSTTGFAFSATIEKDDTFENGRARLELKTTQNFASGWTSVTLTDDPRILLTPDQYLLDVSGGNQTVTYTFRNACGGVPAAGDIILFRLGNGQFAGGGTKLQISGADLTAGAYTVTYETDGTPSTGSVTITTIESNDGISYSVDYEIED